ncbi:hypothetical protein [Streptomyces sp. NPDC046985]|uniref:hypothetical protein n=1 Tax=Streptomyces sp. NPDC046985 TaxID=3155377 RepID=UPI0033C9B871
MTTFVNMDPLPAEARPVPCEREGANTITTNCTSTYTREREQDATTYTCSREASHPGCHRAAHTETVELTRQVLKWGIWFTEKYTVEATIWWSDWEAFLAAQRTAPDATVLDLGAWLATKEAWYAEMLGCQPRYAKLTARTTR